MNANKLNSVLKNKPDITDYTDSQMIPNPHSPRPADPAPVTDPETVSAPITDYTDYTD